MIANFLLKQMNLMREAGCLCDLELVANDGVRFKVHHALFVALNPKHLERYCSGHVNDTTWVSYAYKKMLLRMVSSKELQLVVEFMYGFPVTLKSRFDVLKEALIKLSMDHLLNETGEFTFEPEEILVKTEPADVTEVCDKLDSSDSQTSELPIKNNSSSMLLEKRIENLPAENLVKMESELESVDGFIEKQIDAVLDGSEKMDTVLDELRSVKDKIFEYNQTGQWQDEIDDGNQTKYEDINQLSTNSLLKGSEMDTERIKHSESSDAISNSRTAIQRCPQNTVSIVHEKTANSENCDLSSNGVEITKENALHKESVNADLKPDNMKRKYSSDTSKRKSCLKKKKNCHSKCKKGTRSRESGQKQLNKNRSGNEREPKIIPKKDLILTNCHLVPYTPSKVPLLSNFPLVQIGSNIMVPHLDIPQQGYTYDNLINCQNPQGATPKQVTKNSETVPSNVLQNVQSINTEITYEQGQNPKCINISNNQSWVQEGSMVQQEETQAKEGSHSKFVEAIDNKKQQSNSLSSLGSREMTVENIIKMDPSSKAQNRFQDKPLILESKLSKTNDELGSTCSSEKYLQRCSVLSSTINSHTTCNSKSVENSGKEAEIDDECEAVNGHGGVTNDFQSYQYSEPQVKKENAAEIVQNSLITDILFDDPKGQGCTTDVNMNLSTGEQDHNFSEEFPSTEKSPVSESSSLLLQTNSSCDASMNNHETDKAKKVKLGALNEKELSKLFGTKLLSVKVNRLSDEIIRNMSCNSNRKPNKILPRKEDNPKEDQKVAYPKDAMEQKTLIAITNEKAAFDEIRNEQPCIEVSCQSDQQLLITGNHSEGNHGQLKEGRGIDKQKLTVELDAYTFAYSEGRKTMDDEKRKGEKESLHEDNTVSKEWKYKLINCIEENSKQKFITEKRGRGMARSIPHQVDSVIDNKQSHGRIKQGRGRPRSAPYQTQSLAHGSETIKQRGGRRHKSVIFPNVQYQTQAVAHDDTCFEVTKSKRGRRPTSVTFSSNTEKLTEHDSKSIKREQGRPIQYKRKSRVDRETPTQVRRLAPKVPVQLIVLNPLDSGTPETSNASSNASRLDQSETKVKNAQYILPKEDLNFDNKDETENKMNRNSTHNGGNGIESKMSVMDDEYPTPSHTSEAENEAVQTITNPINTMKEQNLEKAKGNYEELSKRYIKGQFCGTNDQPRELLTTPKQKLQIKQTLTIEENETAIFDVSPNLKEVNIDSVSRKQISEETPNKLNQNCVNSFKGLGPKVQSVCKIKTGNLDYETYKKRLSLPVDSKYRDQGDVSINTTITTSPTSLPPSILLDPDLSIGNAFESDKLEVQNSEVIASSLNCHASQIGNQDGQACTPETAELLNGRLVEGRDVIKTLSDDECKPERHIKNKSKDCLNGVNDKVMKTNVECQKVGNKHNYQTIIRYLSQPSSLINPSKPIAHLLNERSLIASPAQNMTPNLDAHEQNDLDCVTIKKSCNETILCSSTVCDNAEYRIIAKTKLQKDQLDDKTSINFGSRCENTTQVGEFCSDTVEISPTAKCNVPESEIIRISPQSLQQASDKQKLNNTPEFVGNRFPLPAPSRKMAPRMMPQIQAVDRFPVYLHKRRNSQFLIKPVAATVRPIVPKTIPSIGSEREISDAISFQTICTGKMSSTQCVAGESVVTSEIKAKDGTKDCVNKMTLKRIKSIVTTTDGVNIEARKHKNSKSLGKTSVPRGKSDIEMILTTSSLFSDSTDASFIKEHTSDCDVCEEDSLPLSMIASNLKNENSKQEYNNGVNLELKKVEHDDDDFEALANIDKQRGVQMTIKSEIENSGNLKKFCSTDQEDKHCSGTTPTPVLKQQNGSKTASNKMSRKRYTRTAANKRRKMDKNAAGYEKDNSGVSYESYEIDMSTNVILKKKLSFVTD